MEDNHARIFNFGKGRACFAIIWAVVQGLAAEDQLSGEKPSGLPGCYVRNDNTPGLTFLAKKGKKTSVNYCVETCKNLWFDRAGLQNGDECWCGNTHRHYRKVGDNECMESKIWIMSTNRLKESTLMNELIQFGRRTLPACFISRVDTNRGFTFLAYRGRLTTPKFCKETCGNRWFLYMGIQNGDECWCGQSYTGYFEAEMSECKQKKCLGNQRLFCGGNNRLWVTSTTYSLDHGSDVNNCWETTRQDFLAYRGNRNTQSFCRQLCGTHRRKYSATQDGHKCWCGENFFEKGKAPPEDCDKTCSGDHLNTCGGSDAFFVLNSEITDENLNARVIEGCYGSHGEGLVLDFDEEMEIDPKTIDLDLCKKRCGENKWRISVVWEGRQCYCSNVVPINEIYLADDSECTFTCPGNVLQTCGGHNHMDLKATDRLILFSARQP